MPVDTVELITINVLVILIGALCTISNYIGV